MPNRSQDGRVFYRCSRNGVTAIVTAQTYAEIEEWRDHIEPGLPCPGPIFTFVTPERYDREPWHTGTIETLQMLTRGCRILEDDIPVPFSGNEMWTGPAEKIHRALAQVPSLDQIMAAFGLTVSYPDALRIGNYITLNGPCCH